MSTTESSAATRTPTTAREDRARELAARHFHEIAESRDGYDYLVPSCTGAHVYWVHYDPTGESWCECLDFEHRQATCKHLLAVAIVADELHRKGGRFIRPADLEEIAELTGIPYPDLSAAFTGERKNLALDVVKAAVAAEPEGAPESWGESCRWWAKASGRGGYHPALLDAPEISS